MQRVEGRVKHLHGISARNLSYGPYVEFPVHPRLLGTEEANRKTMVFAKVRMTGIYLDASANDEVWVRIYPMDGNAFLPRIVKADDIIAYQ